MSNNINQQLIKNSLYNASLQENRFSSDQFLQTYHKSTYLPSKSYSFREISDWSNRYKIHQDKHEEQNLSFPKKQQLLASGYPRFSYLISKHRRIEPESTQIIQTKKNVQLTPINVKFHSQRSKNIFRKSGSTSPRRIQQENHSSFYQCNYEPLSLLYEMKTRDKKETRLNRKQQLPLILPEFNQMKFPKTQRISSILRSMKKQQQIRVYRQKKPSPQKFQQIRFS